MDFIASIVHCTHCDRDWSVVYHACQDSWLMEETNGGGLKFLLAGGLACPNPECTVLGQTTLVVKNDLVVQAANGGWLDITRGDPVYSDVVRSN